MPWQVRIEGRQVTAFNRADGTRLSFGPTPALKGLDEPGGLTSYMDIRPAYPLNLD